MATIKELVEARKCRTGKAAGTTKRGAYWLALGPVLLRDYGGGGIGDALPDMKNYLYLRHYRSGEVQATVCCEYWHQNTGDREDWQSFPELLGCTTVEDIIVCLKAHRFWDTALYSDRFKDNVTEAMTDLGLPLAAPAPDEVQAELKEHECPHCHDDSFGRGNETPVMTGGWHGGLRFAWGQYAGVHMVRCTGKCCTSCGYVEAVDPEWD